jgi:hypothetical protein
MARRLLIYAVFFGSGVTLAVWGLLIRQWDGAFAGLFVALYASVSALARVRPAGVGERFLAWLRDRSTMQGAAIALGMLAVLTVLGRFTLGIRTSLLYSILPAIFTVAFALWRTLRTRARS